MLDLLKPVRPKSLKALCIHRLEELILSGKLAAGHKLAPERELAQQLGVSRPVVHEALVDLASKGMVAMLPRVGTVVSDYRTEGSLATLNSLLRYQHGKLSPKLLDGLLAMRMLFETETARLAALHRQDRHLQEIEKVIAAEVAADPRDVDCLAQYDFEFHHLITLASDNQSYALLLNSFKPVYTNLSRQFFNQPKVVATVVDFQRDLMAAILARNPSQAGGAMQALLSHGETWLRKRVAQ